MGSGFDAPRRSFSAMTTRLSEAGARHRARALESGRRPVEGFCRSGLCPAARLAVLVALSACARPSVVGTWVGRDEHGGAVVYTFRSDGTGVYTVDSNDRPMRYRVAHGYPMLIEVGAAPGAAAPRRGIVQLTWDGRMRLELGDPGEPAPIQLSRKALLLSRPATK